MHCEERAYSCPQDISSSRPLPSAVPSAVPTLVSCPNPPKTIASKRAPPKERPALLSIASKRAPPKKGLPCYPEKSQEMMTVKCLLH